MKRKLLGDLQVSFSVGKRNMKKIFSIIIPCYNAAGYIDRAMESVIGQTMDRSMYEVIAVNDASTDDTLDHLRNWVDRYPDTVRVISYENNLRQGGARNMAIKTATAEYVCFLDADDWLESDALNTYLMGIGDEQRDIVTAKCEENWDYPDNRELVADATDPVIEKAFSIEDLREYIAYDLGYVCSSIYRREMIINNNVWFPEHLAYEDVYWQRLIKFYAKSACIIDGITLHHYNHPLSTLNKRNAHHHIDRLTCYEMLLDEYLKRGLLERFYHDIMKDTIETYLINSYFVVFINMDNIPDIYSRIRSTIYRYFPDWESEYKEDIPMVFQYLLKFFKKAEIARPSDLQPFKDAVLQIISEE